MDMSKYRKNSSYYKMEKSNSSDFIRQTIHDQAVNEFELYLQYAPNTKKIYVNGSTTSILGNLQDVSDLEIGSDSKWLLTSLKNDINTGDVLEIDGRKWICTYDKEKNTNNCSKVKIQPCTYIIKLPFYREDNTPFVYEAHSIVTTYLTDIKDFKQAFPTETGTSFAIMQYNEFTKEITRDSRIWLYDGAFKVGGVDFTNINFYKDKGYLKFTLRPEGNISDLDNYELGICDYYKYFNKPIVTIPSTPTIFTVTPSSNSVKTFDTIQIVATNIPVGDKAIFMFSGDNMGCTLINGNSNNCELKTSSDIGIVYVKSYLENDPSKSVTVRIVVKNN